MPDEGLHYAIGLPPSQIDFLTNLPGVDFESAWENRDEGQIGALRIPFLGILQLIAAKAHAGRPQDLADLDELRRAGKLSEDGESRDAQQLPQSE